LDCRIEEQGRSDSVLVYLNASDDADGGDRDVNSKELTPDLLYVSGNAGEIRLKGRM